MCSFGGFVFHFVSCQCFDEARKRDSAQVYSMSEINQSSTDLLGVL